MSSMKALRIKAYGDARDVLYISTEPIPTLDEASDKLLVRVIAASVNPLDFGLAKGMLKALVPEKMPAPVGADLSGMVVKAGKGTGFKPGDEVFGVTTFSARGSMAEYCIVDAINCALKPKSISHEEASCLPVVGITALQAFEAHKGTTDIAFIPGGLGGVASISLQLAKKHFGYKRTITTASTAKVDLVKQLIPDVDTVIDYKTVDPATVITPHSCDFILDTVGNPASYIKYASKTTKGKASIISITTPPNAQRAETGWDTKLSWYIKPLLDAMDWYTRWKMPNWVHYDSFFAVADPQVMRTLAELADKGVIKPIIDRVYPMEQAIEAWELAAGGKAVGKVVIRIAD